MYPNEQGSRDFQKGLDPEARRRQREDVRYRLRKKDRERRFQKQRRIDVGGGHSVGVSGADDGASQRLASNNYAPGGSSAVSSGMLDPMTQQMLQDLPQLVQGVWSEHPETQYQSCGRIRKLLSIERCPPIQQVIDSGVVPRLVQLLKHTDYSKLQFEAAWALTNIASGSAEHTAVVIRAGAVPIFVTLLNANTIEVQEQAVWALGNIAGDSPECRNLVLHNHALPKLLPLCDARSATTDARVSLLRNATWTLSNFCRGKPQPPFELIREALGTLTTLLHISDEEVLQDACWAFSYLSDVDTDRNEDARTQNEIVQSGALNRLVELLNHPSNNVKHPALRTIGNIVTGDDMQTQKVINLGALPKILTLLDNDKKSIKKEACWAISNITAGNVEQIEAVIAAGLLQPLIHLLASAEFDVQKEAAWGVSNATSGGNAAQIRFLVNQGVIPPLCNLFVCPSPKIIMVALEGIENILRVGEADKGSTGGMNRFAQFVEECGGLDKLEQVQSRDDIPDDIYEKAVSIVQDFFGVAGDADGDGSMGMDGPQVGADGATFSFGGPPAGGGDGSERPFQF